MKLRFFSCLLILFCIVSIATFADEETTGSKASQIISDFKYQQINWQIPEIGKDIKRVVLKNGMILYLKEDHTFPIVKASAIIRTGGIYETKAKYTVAELTGTLLRDGGTEKYSKEELNKKIEYFAMSIETSIGNESGSALCSFLSNYLNEGFELLAQVLRYPVFDEKQLEIERANIKESIRRKNDEPSGIMSREFSIAVYGDHPYGWDYDWNAVKEITRDDLISFHKKYFHPNNIILAIYGDFKTEALLKIIDKNFGDWKKDNIAFPEIPKVNNIANPVIKVFPKETNQTSIRLGHLGVNFNNPDKYAISIMDFILGGGGFKNRLCEKVRSDRGLAYSVYSSFSTSGRDLGTFNVTCSTKTESTYEAVDLIIKEIERMQNEKITDKELKWAKDSIINSYVLGFEDPFSVMKAIMKLEYFNRPMDYYQKYIENIEKVSIDDVQIAAKKYLKPSDLTFIFVGNAESIKGDLAKLGKVEICILEEFKD